MSRAAVTELEWYPGFRSPEDRGWWYRLMGEAEGRELLRDATLDGDSGDDEIIEALHKVIRADRIEIDLGAVPEDD